MSVQHETTRYRIVPARENPLAVEHVTKLNFRFEIGDWNSNLRRLSELNFRAAIVGRQGTGKTTLLSELHARLQSDLGQLSHYVFLPHDDADHQMLIQKAHERSRQGCVLLIDGFERLSFWSRIKLWNETRNCPGLILNLHRKLQRPFRLPTWIRCRTNRSLLHDLLQELSMAQPESLSEADRLFVCHAGNIRLVLRDLYDQVADGQYTIGSPSQVQEV